MRRYVFLSHANEDKPKLRELVEALLDAGIPLWIDCPEELGLGERYLNCGRIVAGADWQEEIRWGLENASCVLFVLSVASNSQKRSNELFREFEFGKSRNMLVMAQIERVDQSELNPFFRIRQVIDLSRAGPRETHESQTQVRVKVLVERLRDHLLAENRRLDSPAVTMNFADAANGSARFSSAGRALPSDANHHRPARLLPYLTDRKEQLRQVTSVLQAQVDSKTIRPTSFLAVGGEDDCLDAFVEQLRYERLPAFVTANGLSGEVFSRLLHWPSAEIGRVVLSAEEIESHFLDIRAQVYAALGVKMTAGLASLESRLAAAPACCYFYFSIGLDQWGPGQCQLLRRWFAWWHEMDCSRLTHPVVSVVSLVYENTFISRLGASRGLASMRRDVRALKTDAEIGLQLQILPELGRVRFEDVEQWIREHVDNVDREVLRHNVRRHFHAWLLPKRKQLSMYRTANVVKAELSRLKVVSSAS